jgi:2-keto-4-pentenoate hydratase
MRATRLVHQRPCTCGRSLFMPRCDGSHHRPPQQSLSPAFLRASAQRLAAAHASYRLLALIPAPPAGVDWSERDDEFSLARAPRGRDEAAVYASELSRALAAKGEVRVGYKIGGTDAAPFFGELFSRHIVRASALRAPLDFAPRGVELELVAKLAADLPPRADGEPHSAASVSAAVAQWTGALEYCGTRLRGPLAAPAWLRVADGAQIGALVWASDGAGWVDGFAVGGNAAGSVRPDAVAVNLRVNGDVVATGASADARVRGSPLAALVWLANELNARGLPHLVAGDIVTTGTLCGLTAVKNGDVIDAEWSVAGAESPFATLHFRVSQEE